MAAKLTPLISGLIFVFYPIARPISMCLDWMFGEEHELRKYGIAELKEFLAMQVVEKKQENGEIKALTEEELKVRKPYSTKFQVLTPPLLDLDLYT